MYLFIFRLGSIRSSRLSESAVAVPRISNSGSEDIGQEQNVPQQIDLTGDDDEGDRIDDVEGAMDEEDVVEMAADEDDDLLQEERYSTRCFNKMY